MFISSKRNKMLNNTLAQYSDEKSTDIHISAFCFYGHLL